jgi:hypothetical protein
MWEMLEWEVHYLRTIFTSTSLIMTVYLQSVLKGATIEEVKTGADLLLAKIMLVKDEFEYRQLLALQSAEHRRERPDTIDFDALLEYAADPQRPPLAERSVSGGISPDRGPVVRLPSDSAGDREHWSESDGTADTGPANTKSQQYASHSETGS